MVSALVHLGVHVVVGARALVGKVRHAVTSLHRTGARPLRLADAVGVDVCGHAPTMAIVHLAWGMSKYKSSTNTSAIGELGDRVGAIERPTAALKQHRNRRRSNAITAYQHISKQWGPPVPLQ